ncbi:MAG TPA: hypothetical protein VFP67_11315 [Acidimicrobiia bacterium]|jgi:hypothetical protein|nr:hypothetical protein [Acidimicrobiia bacterium]
MTHLRAKDIPTAHRRSSCRRGSHRFDTPQNVGAGIVRRVCVACGSVSIDLTARGPDDEMTRPITRSSRI